MCQHSCESVSPMNPRNRLDAFHRVSSGGGLMVPEPPRPDYRGTPRLNPYPHLGQQLLH